MVDTDTVLEFVEVARAEAGRRIVVGVSGYCGAGKSTLARSLAEHTDIVRLRGDDFLDPARSHRRSSDWDGVERVRLADEVLRPFHEGRGGAFRPYDWNLGCLGDPRPLPTAEVIVVDLIGLFHPETVNLLDVRIWMDLDLATAAERGKARDDALGRSHARLWDEVWVPNDRDFAERFRPRDQAHLIVDSR
ncbi:uridine kinase [Agromyces hippuratus]|uniref:Uridine kinase n=1 Tax=Agromyces hippuratus TaxID=286438 RepID=A0A852X025_9MICO|nr:phosphoglycerate transporter [Agromyces hippuratus]NYG20704.1 uridine kinase [Agromyces hippuratus]